MRHGGREVSPGNLPRPLTSFVGRERELEQAARLLGSSVLLTLTGPGGSGKTRLSVELAASVAGDYPDGVYFVPLAPIGDPGLVPSLIAQHIGLQDSRGRPLIEHLAGYLRDKRLLIVLDNFEHLLTAGPLVTELLRQAREVRIVVSSRACLRVSGEQECPVPPLTLPDSDMSAAEAVAACEAVRLFAERAAAVLPGFAITEQNAAAVAHIARRLDGLPLAIELAAARVKLLPPEAISSRLERSLSLLTGGSRDLPDRQQTLRSTIAWSYNLLSEGSKRLLAVCSVFRGGISLEVIESVCEASAEIGMPVLDGLQELVDQSLLRQVSPSAAPRYAMLETIREFAADRLAEMPAADRVRESHAAAFLAMTLEVGGPPVTVPNERDWLPRLDTEHNNIRAAIDWYRQESPATALRIAAAMCGFWSLHGHFTEGRERLRSLLGIVAGRNALRASALTGAGLLAIDQGDYADAAARLNDSSDLSRALADRIGEGLATAYLARCMVSSSRFEEADCHAQRALALLSDANYRPGVALALMYSGLVAIFTDRLEAASELLGRCAGLCRKLGMQALGTRSLQMLGIARLDLGDLAGARNALADAISASVDLGDQFPIPVELAGFAGLAASTGRPRLALRLAGAAEACIAASQSTMPEPIQVSLDRWLAPARRALGAAADKMLAEGRRMTVQDAVAAALANEPEDGTRPGPRHALTRREQEVAALVARGMTSREVAAKLYISVRTVEVHVDHILTKLGFRTRTQLAAWAHEEGMLAKDT
jgi:non-specific serine/threonine protein kinase